MTLSDSGVRRISWTLGALAVVLIGYHVPAPGVDLTPGSPFAGATPRSVAPFSVLALSIMPWLTAALLVETAGFFVAPLRRWLKFRDGHVDPFHTSVLVLTLLLAIPQAYGIAVSMQSAGMLSADNTLQAASFIATLTAGAMLAPALGHVIETRGIGHGFWVLLAFGVVQGLVSHVSTITMVALQGIPNIPLIAAMTVGLLALLAAALVFVARSMVAAGINSPASFLWPYLLATQAAGWLMGPVIALTADPNTGVSVLGTHGWLAIRWLLMLVCVTPLLAISFHRAGAGWLALPGVALMAVAVVVPALLDAVAPTATMVWTVLQPSAGLFALFMVPAFIALQFEQKSF